MKIMIKLRGVAFLFCSVAYLGAALASLDAPDKATKMGMISAVFALCFWTAMREKDGSA